jgi:CMP-N-acetylneuraminic acid synthetase
MSKILGIIPARGGSKSIPNKNLRELAGRPLLAYTRDAAIAAGVIDRLVLSTDSETIAELGRSLGIEAPFLRPSELAQDDTPMFPVLQHTVRELEGDQWSPDIVVVLQPTSPLRTPAHINLAVRQLQEADCDSVVSVVEIPHMYAPQKALKLSNGSLKFWLADGRRITRRQELEPAYAREGTIYTMWRGVLMEKNSIYGDRCLPLILNQNESLNLDDPEDWRRVEERLKIGIEHHG